MVRVLILCLICLVPFSNNAHGATVGEEISYKADGVTLKGYIAYDDAVSTKRPGIIVVHEWWGHNAYARRRADMLAASGYVALAVDMYGEGRQANHPDEAGKFSAEVKNNLPLARKRFTAGIKALSNHKFTDGNRIAAIGYCFGGGIVLQMARDGLDLKGVASFHGSLGSLTAAKTSKINAEIKVFNGGDDNFVPLESINSFIGEMIAANSTFSFHSYPGALHSFTNRDADRYAEKFKLPLGYNEQADQESWQELLCFFTRIFAR